MKLITQKNLYKILKIIDILLCISIVFLCIKKGGFYISDTLVFNIFTSILGLIYIFLNVTFSKYTDDKLSKKIEIKKLTLEIALILLPVTYMLPIIFNKTINFDDSFFEMIRYLNMTILVFVILMSNNKNWYINTIVIVAFAEIIFGIDGIGLRYFEKFLNYFNSGYLNIDLNRMSGTIQYANTLALIEAICFLILLDKLLKIFEYIKKEKSNVNLKVYRRKAVKFMVLYYIMFLNAISIILTGSRFVLFFLIFVILIYTVINKKYINKIIFLNGLVLITSFLVSAIVEKYILTEYVYYVFSIFTVIYILMYLIFCKIFKKLKFNKKNVENVNVEDIINKKNMNYGYIVVVIAAIYIILAFSITKPLKLDSDNINNANRCILGLNFNGYNYFEIKVDQDVPDTRYSIMLFAQDGKYKNELIKRFDYYNSTSGKFSYYFVPDRDVTKLKLYITCNKGSLKISKCKLNNKNIALDYSLLPADYVYRIEDGITGNSSIADRIEYIKDSFKLIQRSPIIGLGGEAFKDNYKQVQTVKYTSTEAHNSFLQIFVESGICGITTVIVIVILAFTCKYSINKLLFGLLIIHSIVDLNFSYMLIMVIFAILLATTIDFEDKKAKDI